MALVYPMFQSQEPYNRKKGSQTGVVYPMISNYGLAVIPDLP